MDTLLTILKETWYILSESAPYVLFGFRENSFEHQDSSLLVMLLAQPGSHPATRLVGKPFCHGLLGLIFRAFAILRRIAPHSCKS